MKSDDLPRWLRTRGRALPTDRFCPADDDPLWALPPHFAIRAILFTGYSVAPLGAQLSLPYRQCHEISLRVATRDVEDTDMRLCTGYAKSIDAWFRHSWVVNRPDKTLIECTPNTFEAYFGVMMTRKQMERMKKELGGYYD